METKWIKNGGVTSARGFVASGVAAGIKSDSKKDMALVVSECPAAVAATFTTNQVKAAPVKLSMEHVKRGKVRSVIFNSGNANACTGVRGIKDAKASSAETAKRLGCRRQEVLVCSTGRIGIPLPMPKITKGIGKLVKKLSHQGGRVAAKAIMTTDTYAKECAVKIMIDGREVVIGGMAKGAGMIHPNMATMLCCVTTDAAVELKALRHALADAVEQSFNRISVDGDTSTNDTVILLSNGMAMAEPIGRTHPEFSKFQEALNKVLSALARLIIEDGEGITKVVELAVQGANNDADARKAAEAIARSPLVKCSWCGNDPNWGRLMDVLGYSGVKLREELVDIYYNGLLAVKGGLAAATPRARLKKVASKPSFALYIDLHLGKGSYWLLVNDLTEEYVSLNKGE
ncbi:MAG: bifunctional glutamate N-acetyltransferase/amino-acid acetyltransferase ArgJ [Methylacidiphilales bacterium]|nr:bifunctional glutamate N-acetyltransferase/amino-acid acetyltransferase ArgJ [Candidatus Methylacidiphilales bacterium]